MTKKDYELIAEAIRDSAERLQSQGGGHRTLIVREMAKAMGEEFANHLRGTNARFNSNRFVAACTKDL